MKKEDLLSRQARGHEQESSQGVADQSGSQSVPFRELAVKVGKVLSSSVGPLEPSEKHS